MAKLLQRVETTLRCFYVFNSNYCKKEGDEYKKILYYNPEDIELNTKIKDVGLSEAIIQFTGTFVGDDDCKALHTQKTTQLFYQPERGYWIVMVLNVPKEVKSKDGVEVPEYRGTEVQDRIYRAVLRQCYNMFRLSSGTFRSNSNDSDEDNGREQLKGRLSTFFNNYLKTLRFPVGEVLSFMHSIQYLPLEQALFLRAHNFINMIRATFPALKETVLLYDERIISGGQIDAIELCSLHQYLLTSFIEKSEHPIGSSQNESPLVEKFQNGVYVTGLGSEEHSTDLPKIYIKVRKELHYYYIVIFRVLRATLCLLISATEDPPCKEFYDELRSYMEPQLSSIAKDIEENISKQGLRKANTSSSLSAIAPADDNVNPKYIFINEQSLKHLTNIPTEYRRTNKSTHYLPANVTNLIADLIPSDEANYLEDSYSDLKEVQIKTTNDFWIVQRCWNWRRCYVIIHNSKATLLDITQEARRVFDKEFTDDVFFDK
ncbi:vacuolar fusion protein CCZ1 homolog [Bactrocera tryoni]|uniref:vacuolar fusion protein CCZ1 homolog n=1 Tax=Bactrocera tryoni TaxID=59916 RepID=UPI001A98CB9D|nr:vacuolar fusion protein CCZ1 homolog [Bactrocera tryoni]